MQVSLLGTVLVLALAVPGTTHAAFDQFYAGTPGNPQDPILIDPNVLTTVHLFFDTNSVDVGGWGATGVLAWGLILNGTYLGGSPGGGDIFLNNAVSGGDVDALSNCLAVNGTQQTCQALDGGAGAISGVAGIGIAMLSMDILGTIPDSELWATTAEFVDADFYARSAAPRLLARIIPEPGSLLLLGAGLAGTALLRRRRRGR